MVITACIIDAFSPVAMIEFLPFKVMLMLLMYLGQRGFSRFRCLTFPLFSSRLLVIFTRALLQSPREAEHDSNLRTPHFCG